MFSYKENFDFQYKPIISVEDKFMIPFEMENDTKAGKITLEEQITSDKDLQWKYGEVLFEGICQGCPIEERNITFGDLALLINCLKPDILFINGKGYEDMIEDIVNLNVIPIIIDYVLGTIYIKEIEQYKRFLLKIN